MMKDSKLERKGLESLMGAAAYVGVLDKDLHPLATFELEPIDNLKRVDEVTLTVDLGKPGVAEIRRYGLIEPDELTDPDLAQRIYDEAVIDEISFYNLGEIKAILRLAKEKLNVS